MNQVTALLELLRRKPRLGHRIALAVIVATATITGPTYATDSAEAKLKELVESVIPAGWSLVELNHDALPSGHYWGEKFASERGYEIVLEGPKPVYFVWSDRAGVLHRDPLAREALRLYVMPGAYRQDSFKPKGPVPAGLLWKGRSARIYAMPSSRVVSQRAFDELLRQTHSSDWPDSPGRTGQLSWTTWKSDLKGAVRGAYE